MVVPTNAADVDDRVIWTAWFQGRNEAPRHIRRIFDLWEELNPDWRLAVIEEQAASAILRFLGIPQDYAPQMKADIIRLFLLREFGGVWADATLLPVMPLSEWVCEKLAPAGFFAFRSTGDPNLVLQFWFLAANPGNSLVGKWADLQFDYCRTQRRWPSMKRALYHRALIDYLAHRRRTKSRDTLWFVTPGQGRDNKFHPYSVVNYNLAFLLQADAAAAEVWSNVPVH